MSYILVCSPSGTGCSDALEKLSSCIDPGVIFRRDIEDVLCNYWGTKQKLEEAGAPSDSPSMVNITWHLSRSTIVDLWEHAANQCISEVASSKNEVKIICCNLLYYGGRREEFYSPVNPQILFSNKNLLSPSHIIVFIDDVYDMYLRLSGSNEIFDLKRWTVQFYRKLESEEGIQARKIDPKESSHYFLQSQLAVMSRLLTWRNTEIVMAENLAFQCKANFMAWGVKQLSKAMAAWIVTPSIKSVYLSHPIARPRKKLRAAGSWPGVVADFNSLQKAFLDQNIVCVMPTAIDELRIARPSKRRQTLLEERWPLPTGNGDEVLYSCPEGTADMNHSNIISLKFWDFDKLAPAPIDSVDTDAKSDTLLRIFEKEIETQTSSRDHLLVSHADGLLVFRPFIWEGEFSGGVEAEIVHWEFLAKTEQARRAVFIHFDEDVKAWFRRSKNVLDNEIAICMASVLSKELKIPIAKARQVVNWITRRKSEILDKGPLPAEPLQKAEEKMPEIRRKAKIMLLNDRLTYGFASSSLGSQVGLWIVNNIEELKGKYAEIAAFLQDGTNPSNEWHQRIDTLLPDTS